MNTDKIQHDVDALINVLEVARYLSSPFELAQLLTVIVDSGRSILHADRGSVFLYDADSNELFSIVATGEEQIRFSADLGIAGQCARERTIINVPDCYQDPRFNQAIDKKTGYRTKSLITVPLIGLDDHLEGVLQLLNAERGEFNKMDEAVAELLASQAAVAIQRVRLMSDREERMKMQRDLDVARQIQMDALPQQLPACPGYDLAAYSKPAEQTGGDMYDVVALDLPDRISKAETDRGCEQPLFLFLADATGHGIGPALSVTQARSMIRVGLRLAADLDQLCSLINSQLTNDLSMGRFVTAYMGLLDPTNHRLDYRAAGQAPLLHLYAADNQCDFLHASTMPLGIVHNPPTDKVKPMEFAVGDMCALLTDGFFEYQNPAGEEFGKERVAEILLAHKTEPVQDMIEHLLKALDSFAAGVPQADDMTALIIKRVE